MPASSQNIFRDVNEFPHKERMLVFNISMNRIANAQSAPNCFEYLSHLDKKIKRTKGIGLTFVYADYLYLFSDESARAVRDRNINLMWQHKNQFLGILEKHLEWVPKAFSFKSFGQVLLDNSQIFGNYLEKIVDFYKKDQDFKKYVEEDCKNSNKALTENAVFFLLEELTYFYLSYKGLLSHPNDFIQGHEKWILHCYPGKPLKSEVFLFQENPYKLENPKNKYQNCCYDLIEKKLYDFERLNIDTFNFEDK